MAKRFDTIILLFALLFLWQGVHWVSGDAMSSPAETMVRGYAMLATPSFWRHVTETGLAFVYSLALAVIGGLLLGLGLGLNRTASKVADPMLVSLYGLPKVTLYPLILLIFGLGISAKIAFGTIHGILPIAIFAMNSVRNLPTIYLRASRSLRLTRLQTLRRVVIPAAIPEIMSGLRIGFSLTLLGVMIGEMFASQRGLGYLLMNAMGLFDVPTMMVVICFLATIAVTANHFLLKLDRRFHRKLGQR